MHELDQFFTNFHFLRPLWLLLIPFFLVLQTYVRKIDQSEQNIAKKIAPHLLKHLTVGQQGKRKLAPSHFIAFFLSVSCLIAAGPSWQKIQTPFTEDRAPLIIALELTKTMMANDTALCVIKAFETKIAYS